MSSFDGRYEEGPEPLHKESVWVRGRADTEEDFDEVVEDGRPMVAQVEQYAKKSGIELESGWKVEVAKAAKSRLLGGKDPMKGEDDFLTVWENIFERLQPS